MAVRAGIGQPCVYSPGAKTVKPLFVSGYGEHLSSQKSQAAVGR
jgi:hypothetical protein